MEKKKWFLSKAMWAGILTVGFSLYETLRIQLSLGCGVEDIGALCLNIPAVPIWAVGLLGSLGIYGRAKAKTTLE